MFLLYQENLIYEFFSLFFVAHMREVCHDIFALLCLKRLTAYTIKSHDNKPINKMKLPEAEDDN